MLKTAFLIVFVALALAVTSLALLEDLYGDAEYFVATVICLFVIAAGVGVVTRAQFKRLRESLPKLRKQYPVAYFCSWELAGDVNFITSDEKFVKVWKLHKKDFVELMRVERQSVQYEKGKVRVALLRSSTGLVMVSKEDNKIRLPVNICSDKVTPLLSALKGAELDDAIRRISHGK